MINVLPGTCVRITHPTGNIMDSSQRDFNGLDTGSWDIGSFFDAQQPDSDQKLLLGLKGGLMDASKEIGVLKDKLYELYMDRLRLRKTEIPTIKESYDKVIIEKQREIEALRSQVNSLTKTLSEETDRSRNANFQLVQFRALVDEQKRGIDQLQAERTKVTKLSQQKQQRSKYSGLMREIKSILKKRDHIADFDVLEELSDRIFGDAKPVHVRKENNILQMKVEILNYSPPLSESSSIPFVSEKLSGDAATVLTSPSESGYMTTDSNEPSYSVRENDIDEQDVPDETLFDDTPIREECYDETFESERVEANSFFDPVVEPKTKPVSSFEDTPIREECCDETFESEQFEANSVFDPVVEPETKPMASDCDIKKKAIPTNELESLVTSLKTESSSVVPEKPRLETRSQNATEGDQPAKEMPTFVDQSSSKPEAVDRLESLVPSSEEHTSQLPAGSRNSVSVDRTSQLSETVGRTESENLRNDPPATEQSSINEKSCGKSVDQILREMVELVKPASERESLRRFFEQDRNRLEVCVPQEPSESEANTSNNQRTLEMESILSFLDDLSNIYHRWLREHSQLEEFARQLESEPSNAQSNRSPSAYVVVLETTDSSDDERPPDIRDEILNEWIESDTLNEIDLASTGTDPQNCTILEYTTASSPTSEDVLSLENAAHKIHVDTNESPTDSVVCWMDGETPPAREFPEETERAESVAVESEHSEEVKPVSDDELEPEADDWELVIPEDEVKDDAAKSEEPQRTLLEACNEIGTPAADQRRVTRYNLRQKSTPDYAVLVGNVTQRKRSASRTDTPPAGKLLKLEPSPFVRTRTQPVKKSRLRKFENGPEDRASATEEVLKPVDVVTEDPPVTVGTKNPPARRSRKFETVPEDPPSAVEEAPKPLETAPEDAPMVIAEAPEPLELALENPACAVGEDLKSLEVVPEDPPFVIAEAPEPLGMVLEDPAFTIEEGPKALEIVPQDPPFAIEEAAPESPEMVLEDPPSDVEESFAPLQIVLDDPPSTDEETPEPLVDPSPAVEESPEPETVEPSPCLPKFYVESQVETCEPTVTGEKSPFEQMWATIKDLYIPEPAPVDSILIPCDCGVLKTAFRFRGKKDYKKKPGTERNPNTNQVETNKVKRFIEVYLRSEKQLPHVAMANLIASLRFADANIITSALETVLLNSRTSVVCSTLSSVCMNFEVKVYPGFVGTVKTHLKERMFAKFFKVDEGPNSLNMISTTMLHSSFYTSLCKMSGTKEDVMTLLYESLGSLKNRAHPIAYSVLEHWPTVLHEVIQAQPHKKILVDVILFCLAHHRMEYNAELYKVKMVQDKIYEHYRVKLGEKTAQEYARDVILDVTNECWMDSVVLLCKRQMFSWAYTNVMMRYFVPLLRLWKTEDVGEALLLRFAQALRQVMLSCPYNKTITGTYNFDAIITTLSDILHNDEFRCRALKETVYLAIVELSARNFPLCTELLSSWTPPQGRMSYDTLSQLRAVMSTAANYIRWVAYIEPGNTRARFSSVKVAKRNQEEANAGDQQNVIAVGVTRSSQAQKRKCEGETDANQCSQPKKKKKKKRKQKKSDTLSLMRTFR